MKENETIELRSEKVRNIIGKVPPGLVRNGTIYIVLLLLMLVSGAAFIPYPENVRARINVMDTGQSNIRAEAFIPYRFITRIKRGATLRAEMEGYDAREFGSIGGVIESVEDSVINRNGNNYFRVYLSMQKPWKYKVQREMQGIATITVSDKSILQYIVGNK